MFFFRLDGVQGVKSLWGNCSVFPRLGTGETDRWHINGFCATCQCTRCPISEKRCNRPKVIISLDTNFRFQRRVHRDSKIEKQNILAFTRSLEVFTLDRSLTQFRAFCLHFTLSERISTNCDGFLIL